MEKQDFLSRLRSVAVTPCDMPAVDIAGIQYEDVMAQFRAMTEQVGGHVVEAAPGDDLATMVRRLYPEARTVATNMADVDFAALDDERLTVLNPDTVSDAAALNGTDVGVVRGTVAVAENACVWVPQTMREKAVMFISECLVIVIRREDIVSNMHQAYALIETDPHYEFGTFISGPSKTADIEQALVMGAQAARDVTVVVTAV